MDKAQWYMRQYLDPYKPSNSSQKSSFCHQIFSHRLLTHTNKDRIQEQILTQVRRDT